MLRYCFLSSVLFAADVLPQNVALAWADAGALIDSAASPAGRKLRREAEQVMQVQGLERWTYAWKVTRVLPRDIVILRRASHHREDPHDWEITDHGVEALREDLANGGSVFVATGHFSYSSLYGVVGSEFPNHLTFGIGRVAPRSWDPYAMTTRLRMKLIRDAFLNTDSRPITAVELNTEHPPISLVRSLRVPSTTTIVAVDFIWGGRSLPLKRPFLAASSVEFPSGAMRAACSSNAAVYVFVPEFKDVYRRRVDHHWYRLKPPGPTTRTPEELLNDTLSIIEHQVGRDRFNFFGRLGWERKWDAGSESWVGDDATPA